MANTLEEQDLLARASDAFHAEMARKPERYDWLDVAYKVALQQGGQLGASLWPEFVERVRPTNDSRG